MRIKYTMGILLLTVIIACGKKNTDDTGTNPPGSTADTTIKVMTYNIHLANPPSKPGVIDLPAIANVINTNKPDLVALQEVDVYTKRSGINLHEARELAKLTGMYCFFTKALDYDGGQYGDAVLSKFPITDSIRYELPVTTTLGGETRSVALITLTIKNKKIHFASTHLDHLSAEDNRLLQANELVKIVKTLQYPLIIAGDLNATPASQTLAILRSQLTWGCKSSCPFTFSAQNPKSTIDYILFNNPDMFTVKTYVTINETYASDHLPLMAEIEVR
jgi:endonuclease/exonuclease/phosphatase family metal-dependent hydrolase